MVKEIANALQRLGASVMHLNAQLGQHQYLLVGFDGKTLIMEVKAAGQANNDFLDWRGGVVEVATVDDAATALGFIAIGTYV